MRLSYGTTLLAAIVTTPAAVLSVPAGETWDGTTAVARSDDHQAWDGTIAIRRSESSQWYGSGAFYLSGLVTAFCADGQLFRNKVPCGIAIGVSALAGAFPLIKSWFTRSDQDRQNSIRTRGVEAGAMDWNGYYEWDYPNNLMDQVFKAYNQSNGGLPVRMGETACEIAFATSPCFSIWYSREELPEVALHHIQLRPFEFDFRQIQATGETDGEDLQLRGGYVFDLASEATLENMLGLGQARFADSIAEQMYGAYRSTGQFSREGCYCMDFTTDRDSPAGTTGFYYVYSGENGYPEGAEQSIYDICAKEGAAMWLP